MGSDTVHFILKMFADWFMPFLKKEPFEMQVQKQKKMEGVDKVISFLTRKVHAETETRLHGHVVLTH